MRLVKKLIRLLPFIYLITCFIFYIFTDIIPQSADFNLNNALRSLWADNIFFSDVNIFNGLLTWCKNNLWKHQWLNIANSQYLYVMAFDILAYELIVSILFLMFDVFNFLLGIANKWINKGENI